MKEKIILSLICLLLVVGLATGCGKKEKSMKELSSKYLDNTYSNQNDTFTFVNCGYDLFPGSNDRCYFKSEKYNDNVTVMISKENGKYNFEDDYFTLYMQDSSEDYFSNIVNLYTTVEVKTRFISKSLPKTLTSTSSFDDYVNSGKCNMEVYFISNNTFPSEQIDLILNDIANNKIYGQFRFIVTNDEKKLADYTIAELVNEQENKIISKESYSINTSLEIIKLN